MLLVELRGFEPVTPSMRTRGPLVIDASKIASTRRSEVRTDWDTLRHYRVALFLPTKDGVRQVTVTLDFETTEFGDQQRLTYQYNSVVAAHVVDARNGEKKLSLSLTNNPA
ncbi:hypothetical protein AB0K35_30070 [Micromonospora sp. NPDC053740]|uniref:hypothetical protein n=1 Tax=Micromonospora sp. NPDC053740 TaxID=3155173 RepID=UPI003417709B